MSSTIDTQETSDLESKLFRFLRLISINSILLKSPYRFYSNSKNDTSESSYISVLRDGNVVYLNVIETEQAVRVLPRIGNVGPAYATATGKAQLAYYDSIELEKLYSGEFQRITPNSIGNFDQLKEELAEIKRMGYAIDNEEYELGVRCVGAPIKDFMGNVIAGISVSAPSERMAIEHIHEHVAPIVTDAARLLSKKFGYREFDEDKK